MIVSSLTPNKIKRVEAVYMRKAQNSKNHCIERRPVAVW